MLRYKRLLILLIVFSVILLGYFSFVILQDFPNSGDEYAYLFQAQTFLERRLWNPTPPKEEFFQFYHIIQKDGKWLGKYPAGWPFILAAAIFLKMPSWLTNPFLGAFSIFIIYLLATRLFNSRIGLLAAVSVLSSPFFIFNSASYFSHTSCALMILLAYYCGVRLIEKETNKVYACCVGLFIGFSFIIRYYTAILCAVPLCAYIWTRRKKKPHIDFLYIFLGILPFLTLHFWYNYQITGDILLTPFRWYDPYDTVGFRLQFLKSAYKDLLMQFKWMNPSILLLYFYFLINDLIRRRLNQLNCVFALLVLSCLFYPLHGNHYGARYYYEGYALCVLFVVGEIFNEKRSMQGRLIRKFLILFFFAGFLLNLSTLPYYAARYHRQITKRKEVYHLVSKRHLTNAVVFIEDGGAMPAKDLTRNGIDLNREIIYARSLGLKNQELKPYFPARTFYIYSPKKENPDERLKLNGYVQWQ